MNIKHRNALSDAQPHAHPKPSVQELSHLYIGRKMSGRELAAHFGVTQPVVRRWIKYYQLPIRSRREAPSGRPGNDEKHHSWKGDDVSYSGLHGWIRAKKGTPRLCEHCGRTDHKRYHWASIDHSYVRDVTMWLRLCAKCHKAYDKSHGIPRSVN